MRWSQFTIRDLLWSPSLIIIGIYSAFLLFTQNSIWKIDKINDSLPCYWQKGVSHVLVWEIIEDDRPWKGTQILVLKRFDQPVEENGKRWMLAQLWHHPEGDQRPWQGPMRHFFPSEFFGEKTSNRTEAQWFGYEFYDESPTDEQIRVFLEDTWLTPQLGTRETIGAGKITTKLIAGGIDRVVWKKLLGREVAEDLFPELKKSQ